MPTPHGSQILGKRFGLVGFLRVGINAHPTAGGFFPGMVLRKGHKHSEKDSAWMVLRKGHKYSEKDSAWMVLRVGINAHPTPGSCVSVVLETVFGGELKPGEVAV